MHSAQKALAIHHHLCIANSTETPLARRILLAIFDKLDRSVEPVQKTAIVEDRHVQETHPAGIMTLALTQLRVASFSSINNSHRPQLAIGNVQKRILCKPPRAHDWRELRHTEGGDLISFDLATDAQARLKA